VSELEDLLVEEATPVFRFTRQRLLLLSSCIMLLVCFPIAVFSWAAAESSTSLLLVGDVSGLQVGLIAGIVTLVAFVVTPIQVDGCSTGYVAIERFAGVGNFVGVREGIHMIKVHEYWADDFGMPFSNGTATIHASSGEIDISYPGGSGFSLPILETAPCP